MAGSLSAPLAGLLAVSHPRLEQGGDDGRRVLDQVSLLAAVLELDGLELPHHLVKEGGRQGDAGHAATSRTWLMQKRRVEVAPLPDFTELAMNEPVSPS
jgi:hypothetical protein